MKRFVSIFLITLLSMGVINVGSCHAQLQNRENTSIAAESVSPMESVIIWIVKKIGNKYYKRQYDTTKQKWIGNWIPVD